MRTLTEIGFDAIDIAGRHDIDSLPTATLAVADIARTIELLRQKVCVLKEDIGALGRLQEERDQLLTTGSGTGVR